MSVKVYYASVTGSQEMRKHQEKIFMIIDSKKVEYEKVDIASIDGAKDKMRALMGAAGVEGAERALPPQIFNEEAYCGNFEAFHLAVEDGELETFLKLK
mmetsp:Transcript_23032/g.60169  ORF Transcript_23032/g.60169 Transcript_23032/m.60169 type:complete len:99 (-) Transcript_23032:1296-1592(-)